MPDLVSPESLGPSDGPYGVEPEAWLAAIVDSSDDAIIGKTLDSVIRSWNVGATRIFGFAAHEAIGRPVYQIIPPELHHQELAIISRLVQGERIDHFETVRLRKDGTRIDVSLSVSPIRDQFGRIVGAAKIARDISEAKRLQRAERELSDQLQEFAAELEMQVEEGHALQEELEQQVEEGRSLQAELEATNEELTRSLADAKAARLEAEEANAAKGQFLAMMSHELRTPLNAIGGYADILELEIRGELTPEQKQDVRRIKRSGETLLRLIEDVLSFAKLESGRLEYRYETMLIDDALASLEQFVAPRLIQKGLAYRFERCGPDVSAVIDRDKVEQIVLNLLSNAVKFTETGRIDVRCLIDEHTLAIEVRDTGRGIRSDLFETIFEPFVQGDYSLTRTAEGTGLGLAISRQLARAMGGDITVRSVPDEGSTFALTLPRYR